MNKRQTTSSITNQSYAATSATRLPIERAWRYRPECLDENGNRRPGDSLSEDGVRFDSHCILAERRRLRCCGSAR
jgi:hypothetical protein